MLLFILALACTASDSTVTDTLSAQGFTNVETHGHAWFACSDDDHFATSFTATNPAGEPVSGAVCCGWVKNCTVRW